MEQIGAEEEEQKCMAINNIGRCWEEDGLC
jgi:hypothetical protein